MKILLLGASGFIGRHVGAALEEAGHRLIRASRRPARGAAGGQWIRIDFAAMLSEADWVPLLEGVDIVINAVGILRETPAQTFERIHVRAPQALFRACAAAPVTVVHISALGADAGSDIAYFRSKGTADEFLLHTTNRAVVLRPSLVFGLDGESARLFTWLAALPVLLLPGQGEQDVQPIHVDDLAAAIRAVVLDDQQQGKIIALVGPHPLTLRQFLETLREQMGRKPPLTIAVPLSWMDAAARLAQWHRSSLLCEDTLAMLQRGNIGDPSATAALLGRLPRAPGQFIPRSVASMVSATARLGFWLSLLRYSIALVWILSGIVSLGIYPPDASYALLERVGLRGAWASVALYGAAALDILLGLATLFLNDRRRLWVFQAVTIVVYTVIISFALPELWAHPFGPVLKNIPLLVAIGMMRALER